jgi:hypothetical protein
MRRTYTILAFSWALMAIDVTVLILTLAARRA